MQVMESDAALLDWLETLDRLALASPLKQVIFLGLQAWLRPGAGGSCGKRARAKTSGQ